ncbi:FHA domain-containing protein [Cryobacterium sp. ZS14-85]|uniref:FHA domain-containing protein n=2 Tax=Cryobacterium zhongshanensis TaxID=2928153 RepID=A0AA41QWW1_9MICO|nr:FHA domain-containing protein [Cryobacterium zhongshanensis]
MEATRISARRARPWILETGDGVPVSLTSPVVFLGRNPAGSGEYPEAQLVAVADTGKTVSKSHARIELSNGVWTITDLRSTNGIVLIDGAGDERELVAGASALLTERFLLGELAARIFLES